MYGGIYYDTENFIYSLLKEMYKFRSKEVEKK